MTPADSILILTTDGTIDKQYIDALSQYQITDTAVIKLLSIARAMHPYVYRRPTRAPGPDREHGRFPQSTIRGT
jgi:hypothetical protein